MKNETKTVFWGFLSLDYSAMEMYLEEMAKKGWMLIEVGKIMAKFTSIEPKDMKFCVDVFEEGGLLVPENTKEVKEYRRKCEGLGWNFITSQNYLQFFYTEDQDLNRIQNNEAIEIEVIKKTLFKNELLGILVLTITLLIVINNFFPIKYTNLLTYIGVFGIFVYPVLVMVLVLMSAYQLLRLHKTNKNVNEGIPIERPTLKDARQRAIAFYGVITVFILTLILTIMVDSFGIPNLPLITLLGPITGISIGLLIKQFIEKKSKTKRESLFYGIGGVIVAVVIFQISAPFLIKSIMGNDEYQEPNLEGYPIVTMEDLNKEPPNGSYISKYFKTGKSPIIPKHYEYWETLQINNTRESIRINYYEVMNPYFSDIVFKSKSEEIRRLFSWSNKTFLEDNEMKDLWNVDQILLSGDGDIILLQKENIVVYILVDLELEDGTMREIITQNLLP